ncbi:MAG: zf-HC2 domain-containing protein [Phycisphaerae bacterium]|nr:zf-HC2 domain-containing protein [Phycisphaerae bacterium]
MAEYDETSRDLSAYLDGELGAADARRVAEALDGSSALRQELAELRALRALMLAQPCHRGGADLTARIVAAAEQLHARGELGPAASSPLVLWARRLAVAAVLVIAAGAGVMVSINWLGGDDLPPVEEIVATEPPPEPLKERLARDPIVEDAKRGSMPRRRSGTSVPQDAGNEVIVTHDLDLVRRDVEKALLDNGLRADVVRATAKIGKGRMPRGGGYYYRFSSDGAETISCEVLGTAEQVTNLRADLGRIRRSQFVDQAPAKAMKAPGPVQPARPGAKPGELSSGSRESKGEHSYGQGAPPRPTVNAKAKNVARKPADHRGQKGAADGQNVQIATDRAEEDREKGILAKLSDMLDTFRGGRTQGAQGAGEAPQTTSGPAGTQQQKKELLAVEQGLEDALKQQARTRPGEEKRDREAAELVGANVQRLVITLNKTVLTREAEARRAAQAADAAGAVGRSPPAAKE